jgi:hypothetical protein
LKDPVLVKSGGPLASVTETLPWLERCPVLDARLEQWAVFLYNRA